MTQGFPPGQRAPQTYPRAAYPQQQPPPGYPQQGISQYGASRGWLIVLFVAALVPAFVGTVAGFALNVFDIDASWFVWWGFYDGNAYFVGWLLGVVDTVFIVASATVLFRSNVGRVLLFVAAAILVLDGLAGTALSLLNSEPDWPVFEMAYLPVLVIAFLPPVNRAFRRTSVAAGHVTSGHGGQLMQPQPAAPHGYTQQPQPLQAGYPNQPWQQGPPR